MCFEGALPALIYLGGQGYFKSPSRIQWESYYNTIGQFHCSTASSTPIRVVTRASGRFLGCAQRYCTYGPRALNGPSWGGKRSELGRALQLG